MCAREMRVAALIASTRRPAGLEHRILLGAEGGTGDVFEPVERQPHPAGPLEEHLLLGSHRRRLDGQRLLDPFVVRDQLAVGQREQVPLS